MEHPAPQPKNVSGDRWGGDVGAIGRWERRAERRGSGGGAVGERHVAVLLPPTVGAGPGSRAPLNRVTETVSVAGNGRLEGRSLRLPSPSRRVGAAGVVGRADPTVSQRGASESSGLAGLLFSCGGAAPESAARSWAAASSIGTTACAGSNAGRPFRTCCATWKPRVVH